MAARVQLEALAGGRLSPDITRPELFKIGRDIAGAETHSIVASVKAQAQRRRDWYYSLREELVERRLVAYQLMTEGLRLIAPDERRQFADLAMRLLDGIEPSPAVPSA
jgi:hypothetical protein